MTPKAQRTLYCVVRVCITLLDSWPGVCHISRMEQCRVKFGEKQRLCTLLSVYALVQCFPLPTPVLSQMVEMSYHKCKADTA